MSNSKLALGLIAGLFLLLSNARAHCVPLKVGQEAYESVWAAAWSSDENKVATIENDRVLRVLGIDRTTPLWTKRIEGLPEADVINEGLLDERPKLSIYWLNKINMIAIAYISDKNKANVIFFDDRNGTTIYQYPLYTSKTYNKKLNSAYLRGESDASQRRLALLYTTAISESGRLITFDFRTKKNMQVIDNVNSFHWLANKLIVEKGGLNRTNRKIYVVKNGNFYPLSVGKPEDVNGWTTDKSNFLYVLMRSNQSSSNIALKCYEVEGNRVYEQWQKTWTTGFREPGGPNTMLPSKFGEIAIDLPYGTDGFSNARIWCASSNRLYTAHQILVDETHLSGMNSLAWRGESLLLNAYPISKEDDSVDNRTRFYLFSLTQALIKEVYPTKEAQKAITVSPTYRKAVYRRKAFIGYVRSIGSYIN